MLVSMDNFALFLSPPPSLGLPKQARLPRPYSGTRLRHYRDNSSASFPHRLASKGVYPRYKALSDVGVFRNKNLRT